MAGKGKTVAVVTMLTLADLAANTVFYMNGADVYKFMYGINFFSIFTSMFDTWILGVLRVCLMFGAVLSVLCNARDAVPRIKLSRSWVGVYPAAVFAYTITKLLLYSEKETDILSKLWFWAQFGGSLVGCVIFYLNWSLLSNIKTQLHLRSVNKEEGTEEETRTLVDKTNGQKMKSNKVKEEDGKSSAVLKLISYSKPDMAYIIGATAFLLAAAVSDIFEPYYTGQVIDGIAIEKSQEKFTRAIVVLTLLSITSSICAGIRGGLFTFCMARLNIRLRKLLFKSITQQEIGFFDSVKTGDITSRLTSDTSTVSNMLSLNLNVFLRSFVRGAGTLVFMFKLSWQLTTFTLVIVPVVADRLSGGNLVSFILYQKELGDAIELLGSVYTGLMQAVGASEKVFEYIDRKPEIQNNGLLAPDRLEGHIEFKDVSFAYPSRKDIPVLKDVSFKVSPGEVVALVGPSGSGKSTCVNLLERFYETMSGQVLLDGNPIMAYDHKFLHRMIALVGQEPVLFARSIKDNISYALDNCSLEEVQRVARQANAHQFITELPEGYETETGEKGMQLSGGQKQRVAIARALIRKPAVLLLDEATSALDAESEHLVQQAINNLHGHTVIVIAHRLSTVEKADRIIVIDKGTVVEQGRHGELMQQDGLYAKLITMKALVLISSLLVFAFAVPNGNVRTTGELDVHDEITGTCAGCNNMNAHLENLETTVQAQQAEIDACLSLQTLVISLTNTVNGLESRLSQAEASVMAATIDHGLGTELNPADSCLHIKQTTPSSQDGAYFLVACTNEDDMYGKCTAGDRWSSTRGNNINYPEGDGNWANVHTFGSMGSATTDDYKNPGYFSISASNVMLWHVPNNVPAKNYKSAAYLRYRTSNGFLDNYGGNLYTLCKDHYPIGYGLGTQTNDNGPAIPIVYEQGSDHIVEALLSPNVVSNQLATPGFVQFRVFNGYGACTAVCPGVSCVGSECENMCIGGGGYSPGGPPHCGDYGTKDWDGYGTYTGFSTNRLAIESVVMFFYR
uniref:Uncharacterized protein n=1 Tax=Branchiostoma floridae TaxID=7739 RepID=C3YCV8_BRAFL|eukprot:XP_002605899.1 hypothetical protein BRAFLDRAFT_87428 [Branchiostoma floridae]